MKSILKKVLKVSLACVLLTDCCKAALTTPPRQGDGDIDDKTARLEYARVLKAQKKDEAALEQYQRLLSESSTNPVLLIETAQVLVELKRDREAKDLIGKLNEKNLNEDEKLMLANLYSSWNGFDQAKGILEEMLSEHPESLKTRLLYAQVLSWEKKYPDSIAQYEILLKERPNDIQLRRKYALVLIWSGNREQGAEELRKTLDHS